MPAWHRDRVHAVGGEPGPQPSPIVPGWDGWLEILEVDDRAVEASLQDVRVEGGAMLPRDDGAAGDYAVGRARERRRSRVTRLTESSTASAVSPDDRPSGRRGLDSTAAVRAVRSLAPVRQRRERGIGAER